MNIFQGAGIVTAAVFGAVALYIIQSRRPGLFFFARIRGGVEFWRGGVFAGGVVEQGRAGVKVEQGGGADGGAFRKAAAGSGLAVGLAADAKGGGASGAAGVAGFEQFEKLWHGAGLPVHRARRRVVVSPSWDRFAFPACLRQRVVDGAGFGQSIPFMPL